MFMIKRWKSSVSFLNSFKVCLKSTFKIQKNCEIPVVLTSDVHSLHQQHIQKHWSFLEQQQKEKGENLIFNTPLSNLKFKKKNLVYDNFFYGKCCNTYEFPKLLSKYILFPVIMFQNGHQIRCKKKILPRVLIFKSTIK